MRTKTLLLTAALAAAGLNTAAAQNGDGDVFSVNAVGFVNVELPQGFEMIANPLDAEDNTVGALLSDVPDGTIVYKFDAESGTFSVNSKLFGSWDNPDETLEPGDGAFVNSPEATSVTFVGEVPQGTLENEIPAGFSIQSSMVPQSGQLDTDLGFPAADGDIVYRWDNSNSSYSLHSFVFGGWDTPPEPAVGEAFFVNKVDATTWTREFSVSN